MSPSTKRLLVSVGAVAMLAAVLSLTGAPAASGQTSDEAVPVVAAPAPASRAESSGPRTSPGFAGTGAAENGMASEATVESDGTFEGQPMGGESVIGADGRVQVTDTTQYPARAIGQIELIDSDGGSFICTGWLIDPDTILTSGHCAYNPSPFGDAIIQSAQFFPGRNGSFDPYGGCNVTDVFSRSGWRINGQAKHDWAVMELDCTIGNTVGWLGYFALPGVNQLDGKTGRVEGYPGDKPYGTHWKMSGTMASRSDANMIHYAIDTAGGQSGSPIMVANRPACGGPCGMGIHSYGSGGNPPLNSGPRITFTNFDLISDFAAIDH
jgi:glutamyl endopeptidase